ncbi:MAG TPA: DUF222 domain-containing protein [Trebonia sp.]|nr:DUF222 domain-containing protein [Trebonia sp.]
MDGTVADGTAVAGVGAVADGAAALGDVAEALALAEAAADYLNGPDVAGLDAAALGGVLQSLGAIGGKFAAARAAILARFDAERGHDADGYGSSASWLAAKNKTTRKAANAEVRRMRQFREHPQIARAVASGAISEAWAGEMADWTRRLPEDWRADVDRILLETAAAGAGFDDLAMIAQAAYEKWRQQQADPDDPDDGFDERYLKLATTIDDAGRVTGNLTPECAAALQAVLEALGKKAGPQDDRTEVQRRHDALQEACELLIRAGMVPDRAGTDTRVDVVVALSQLREMPGARALEDAWLAALAGQHGHLAGIDAEVAACDALVSPVVIGHPDVGIVDEMIEALLGLVGRSDPVPGRAARTGSKALSPEAWQALRYAIARLAVDLVAGQDGIASALRRGLLERPYNSKPVILDVGFSASVPSAIRRAVQLRARGNCEWPGCQARAARCDVHHLVHQSQGGETSLRNCVLLCQFHHDVCVHRRGWRLVLHPDATTTAYGPNGQVLHSHGPPDGKGSP